ncbi:MAG: GNAT family N-acetyltransferase [Bacilli bacterium]
MKDIVIRNAIYDDNKDMEDFYFYGAIKQCLKYKMILKTSFVAEHKGKVIGIIICEKSLIGAYDIKILEVNNLYKRNGVGTLLLKKVKEVTKNKTLTVYYPRNNNVESFYEKNGFIIGDKVKVCVYNEEASNLNI